jgi:hypothetical protein
VWQVSLRNFAAARLLAAFRVLVELFVWLALVVACPAFVIAGHSVVPRRFLRGGRGRFLLMLGYCARCSHVFVSECCFTHFAKVFGIMVFTLAVSTVSTSRKSNNINNPSSMCFGIVCSFSSTANKCESTLEHFIAATTVVSTFCLCFGGLNTVVAE